MGNQGQPITPKYVSVTLNIQIHNVPFPGVVAMGNQGQPITPKYVSFTHPVIHPI